MLAGSHKRRDNRCAIAAPKLEHCAYQSTLPTHRGLLIAPTIRIALTLALEREGWEVHHQVEDPSISGPALEDDPVLSPLSPADTEAELRRRLQHVDAEHKRALILYSSHIGGHKYAGNVIVRIPTSLSLPCPHYVSIALFVGRERRLADRVRLHCTDQHAKRRVDMVWACHAARGGRNRAGDYHRRQDSASTPAGWDEPVRSWTQDPQRLVAQTECSI